MHYLQKVSYSVNYCKMIHMTIAAFWPVIYFAGDEKIQKSDKH